MKKNHKWTIKDITYLKGHRKEKTVAGWAEYFGVTPISIENILRVHKIKGDHWTKEDDAYLIENRPLFTAKELATHFNVTEMAILKRCEKIGAVVGHRRNAGRRKSQVTPKANNAKVVSMRDNIEKLWQQQKKRNASKIKGFQSIQRDFSKYKAVKLTNRTTILIKPGMDIGKVIEVYKNKKIV